MNHNDHVRQRLLKEYRALKRISQAESTKTKQQRGRDFENILRDLLDLENLAPEIRVRPGGEEIDGSFKLQTRYFLLEAKWTSAPQPASSLYEFRGKVQGKLVGTLGVFIAVNGFAPDCPDALVKGKSLDIILFDGEDIEGALQSDASFTTILDSKLRMASDYGVPFAPWREIISKKAELSDFLPKLSPQDKNISAAESAKTIIRPFPLEISGLNEFLLNTATYIDAFVREIGLKELPINPNKLISVAMDMERHFAQNCLGPPSVFTRAATFFICFIFHRPVAHLEIPIEQSLTDVPNHQNIILAFSIAIAFLHEAVLSDRTGTIRLQNRILVSKQFYFKFIRTYSNLDYPHKHIDTLALLFEEMAYGANPASSDPKVI
jgi:hypothetical protein